MELSEVKNYNRNGGQVALLAAIRAEERERFLAEEQDRGASRALAGMIAAAERGVKSLRDRLPGLERAVTDAAKSRAAAWKGKMAWITDLGHVPSALDGPEVLDQALAHDRKLADADNALGMAQANLERAQHEVADAEQELAMLRTAKTEVDAALSAAQAGK